MKQRLILVMVVCLLAGIGGGYTAGYALYVPKIRSYATQVSELTSQVFNLEQSVSSLEQEISSLEQEVSNQKAQIATKEGQINSLESEQASLKSDLTAARDQVWEALEEARTLKSELSSSKQQLTNVLGIKVIQSYQWDYGMETWEWNLQIPLSLYVEYRDRRRQPLGASWVNMAKDTGDDLYIDQITQRINETAMENGFTEPQKINFVIAFVQNLPYTVDSETTPWNE
ncbi:MAG: hypothetical protein HYX83_03730, partial [Chloroflexi bacterium]|nr:hypothetical protein [Chloroflexota bacterium]